MFEDELVEGIPEDPLGIVTVEDVLLQRLIDSVSPRPALVDQLSETASRARMLAAERFRLIDAMRREAEAETGASWTDPDSLEWRSLRAEVAAALEIHERSAQAQLDLARQLVHVFPDTLDSLSRMVLSERHARILVEQSTGMPEGLLAEYEQRLLPHAHLVPSRFEKKALTIRLALDGEGMIELHQEAVKGRRVAFEPAAHGMAWFGGHLAAEDGVAALGVVEGIARRLKALPGETRTLDQIRADVFRDLLLDPAGMVPAAGDDQPPQPSARSRQQVSPTVFVHIPALSALGRSNVFGILEQYGPIDAETARKLAGESERWLRILTDPETGVIVKYGRVKYRFTEEVRQTLRIRDGVCRFVGCTRPAVYCDLDHTHAWEDGGGTDDCNLAHLCRHHHRLKHGSPWNVTQDADGSGTLTWTSPKGRVHRTYADTLLPPPTRGRSPGSGSQVQQEWLAAAAGSEAVPPF